jgi:thiol-disulfide isomerase/thioredoxin
MQVVFFLLLSIFSALYNDACAQLSGYRVIEREALEMSVSDENGKEISIKDKQEFPGKIMLLNFWAPFCKPCITEMPSINNLSLSFSKDELSVVTVCLEPAKFKEQAKSAFHIGDYSNLKLYFDHESAIQKKINSRGIPVTLILDQNRNIIGRLDGATSWDHHENVKMLSDLVAEKESSKPVSLWEKITGIFVK